MRGRNLQLGVSAEYISHSIAASNKQITKVLVEQNKRAGLICNEINISMSITASLDYEVNKINLYNYKKKLNN